MQQRWRTMFGMSDAFPKDCTECFAQNGGNLVGVLDYLVRKRPNFQGGLISSQQDEIIRLFYSAVLNTCRNFETADPTTNFLTGIFPGPQYVAGLADLRTKMAKSGRFATYFIPGVNHQHIRRPRFFTRAAGNVTIAQWTSDLLSGKFVQVGP